MSPRSWQNRVEDILTCARNIHEHTDGMSFDDFIEDSKTIRAIAFEFTTIGEAARAVPAEIQERFPDVPWARCRGSVTYWCTSISVSMKKFSGKQHRKKDIPPLIKILEHILQSK